MSNSLQPHRLKHARLPCPSPTPRTCSNSCPSSWWGYPTISSSVIPFSCLQTFPVSGSVPLSQFFASGGQSTEVSASASVFPMNIQDWSPLGLTGLISLQSKGLSQVFSNTIVQKHHNSSAISFLYSSTLISIHNYWKKTQSQRKATPKNAQTTVQLQSSHMLVKKFSKFSKPGFNSTWTVNLQMFKMVLEKAEEPEIKLPTSTGSSKSKRVPEKHLFLFYWPCQSFSLCGSQ